MQDQWITIYNGEIEGRKVELLRYGSGELTVITTQKETEVSSGYSDGSTHILPYVISEGNVIHIDANTPDELESELQGVGFSSNGAKQISNLAQ